MTTHEKIDCIVDEMENVLYEDETGFVSENQLIRLIEKADRIKRIAKEALREM